MPRTMPSSISNRKVAKSAPPVKPAAFRSALLGWYDAHARVLPWRARGGKTADPYHVWLSEVMLQQTTVQAVIPYFGKFVDKWPRVQNLAAAQDDEVMHAWAGLGYYARARNLLKCARVVAETHSGVFPDTVDTLKSLPGIGDYTAAAVAAIAFNRVETVIDGNVDRVVSRWFAIETPLPDSKPEIRAQAKTLFEHKGSDRPGDFAQAMMDLGATICIPQNPRCDLCPVSKGCQGRAKGIAAELPRRKPKAAQPRRAGYVYWIENERGEILFETRPGRGLLGGMVGLPTSDWVGWPAGQRKWPEIDHKGGHISAMKIADDNSMKSDLKIRHTFTHFDLELRGVLAKVKTRSFKITDDQFWVPATEITALGLPTVFRKFTRLMDGT